MTAAEEQEAIRRAREAEVRGAWIVLATNKDFLTIWNHDLQRAFPPLKASFRSDDGYNPIPAAMRDGEKSVIAHIAKKIGIATAMLDEEEVTKPTEAVVEFQGESTAPKNPRKRK